MKGNTGVFVAMLASLSVIVLAWFTFKRVFSPRRLARHDGPVPAFVRVRPARARGHPVCFIVGRRDRARNEEEGFEMQ